MLAVESPSPSELQPNDAMSPKPSLSAGWSTDWGPLCDLFEPSQPSDDDARPDKSRCPLSKPPLVPPHSPRHLVAASSGPCGLQGLVPSCVASPRARLHLLIGPPIPLSSPILSRKQ